MTEGDQILIKVHLSGGPCDGAWAWHRPGDLFLYVHHKGNDYIYGLGDDGKYYYCPEIPDETNQETT